MSETTTMGTTAGTTSSTPSAADSARRLFECLSRHDLDGVGELQHEDVIDDFVAVGVVRGKAEVRRFFADLFAAFPDFRLEVRRVTSSGDVAVVEWTAEATFTGKPFQGVAATGKRVVLRGVDCMRFDGGRLRSNVIYYDGAGFARDIGLLPPLGSAAEKGMTTVFNAVTRAKRLLSR